MNIIVCHNWYRSNSPSGENIVVARELELLKKSGIKFHELMRYNDALDASSLLHKLAVTCKVSGSEKLRNQLKKEINRCNAAKLLHAHNVMPLITYEVFRAAKEMGLMTIQTLHNYRLAASYKHFYTTNRTRPPQNRAEEIELHRMNSSRCGFLEFFYERAYRKIWHKNYFEYIDKFICLTNFQREQLIKCGLPREKLYIKPNFLLDKGITNPEDGKYAIFVGRLTSEKGILPLCQLWQKLAIPLYVVGSGPEEQKLPHANNIHYLGQIDNAKIIELIANARFLVMNPMRYETFGLVLIEALSCGIPCLAPNFGAITEIITDGVTGLTFDPEDMHDLANKAQQLWEESKSMQQACRKEYENKYTPEINLRILREIYNID